MNAPASTPRFSLKRLDKTGPTPFLLVPDKAVLERIAGELDLLDLRKLRLEGRLTPEGRSDWRLEATFGATAIQPCSVTLAPVTTRIDTKILRRYLADYSAPTEAEAEMPEDDSIEPLPEVIDLLDLATEALALALPDFPRAEGAELGEAVFTEPGHEPMSDEATRPFASLARLKKSMEP